VTRRLYLIARWCAEHAKLVLALWFLTLIVLSGLNNRLPPPGLQEIVLPGTDSATAQTLLNRAFPGASTDAQPLVVACEDRLDRGPGQRTLDEVIAATQDVDGVTRVVGPADRAELLSPDRRTALVQVQVDGASLGEPAVAQDILDAGAAAAPGCKVALGGFMGQSLSQVQSRTAEVLGLFAAVIVLLFTLRRFGAAFVPLINAVVTVGIGTALIGLLGRLVFIPDIAPILGSMLGLGVGIDYALFLIMRNRAMLRRGFDVPDAVGRTSGTAGAGMFFAGCTLILALSGLALTQISFLAWLGLAAAVVIAVAILTSLTFVPAVLGLMGRRILPKKELHAEAGHDHASDEHLDRGMWARIANAVTSRPWRFAIGATILLVFMALPMLRMEFGQADASALPADTTAYRANELISDAFGPGKSGPLAVVLKLNRAAQAPDEIETDDGEQVDPRTLDPRLLSLEQELAATAGIEDVGDAVVSPDGGVAVIRITPTSGPADPATQDLVASLRADVLPAATAEIQGEAHIGGGTALSMDLTDQIAASLPLFIAGVVVLSGSLLLLAYRSIVIPVKAALMNLLSICAAYGVVVAIFQFGWGASLLGVDELVPIEPYVPMMMFAVLFGLSMDYEVFLLTGFREHWDRTGDMVVSVRRGLADTGKVVTAAATIMVVVFASFILLPGTIIKMFGVGLSTAVLVDATIVRCLLVPSLMILAAKYTWWLPKWLDRALPHLQVEGDPAALESIHQPPQRYRPATVREATQPAVPLLPVLIGAGLAWIVGSRVVAPDPDSPFQSVAVAISVVVGGLVVWLPQGLPGAGSRSGTRVIMMLLGSMFVAIVYTVLASIIPFTQHNPGLMAAWGLLALTLLAAFTRLSRHALPLILGAVVMAVTLAVEGSGAAGQGTLVETAILPAFLAGLVAIAVNRLLSLLHDKEPAGGRADATGDEDRDPELAQAAK
jgi:RND superfamily putative drug exporter